MIREKHAGHIDPASSVLLVIDVQEKLAPAMPDRDSVLRHVSALIEVANLLAIPVIFTEHCAERIGPTLPSLVQRADAPRMFAKTHFSATREPHFHGELGDILAGQVILCGMETHVCVLQTAMGLAAQSTQCFLACDAVASRKPLDKQTALNRAARQSIEPVTTEMVIFEWLEHGNRPEFRDALKVIKSLAP